MSSEVQLTTGQIDAAHEAAAEAFSLSETGSVSSARYMKTDTREILEWRTHFARAIEQAVRAQWAAEVDRQISIARKEWALDWREKFAAMETERDSAQAEAKRNAKDAARYRLLTEVHGPRSELCFDGEICSGKAEFDALIDAKLAALQPGASYDE